MKALQHPAVWRPSRQGTACLLVLALVVGCAGDRSHLDVELLAERGGPVRNGGVSDQYLVAYPDVLEVVVQGRSLGPVPVDVRGLIELPELGTLRVERLPVSVIAEKVAQHHGLSTADVDVRVVEYRSQSIYLFGEVMGSQRPVPYRGPETVLDLLQRCGGIRPGAAPEGVYVVRPHVCDGGEPEVYHIDLTGILREKDDHSNIRLKPFDKVYVGPTRQCIVLRCLPEWMKPIYELLWGLNRPRSGRKPAHAPGA